MYTTRLSDDIIATAETVGAHPEPTDPTLNSPAEVPTEPKTKVVKASSRGVKTK